MPASGQIRGTFMFSAGPVPTCVGESPCPSAYTLPEAHVAITVATQDGTIIARTATNASGHFAVDVPSGTFIVATPEQSEPGQYNVTVTVDPGETVDVNLSVTEP